MSNPVRYAIYYLPESDDPLWAFGSSVLGYDALTGAEPTPPSLPSIDSQGISNRTRGPRVYGFHATLKAPFRLRPETHEDDLLAAAGAFANAHEVVSIGEFGIETLDGFVALVPRCQSREVSAFGEACVRWFDSLRAPMTAEERAKRVLSPLSARENELLDRWGYPYVFDMFRFHMTLTGVLARHEAESIARELGELHAPLVGPRLLSSICVCAQAPGDRFRLLRRFPLTGSGIAGRG